MSIVINTISTVKYMTPRQWKYRLYYTIRNRLVKRKVKTSKLNFKPNIFPLNYGVDINRKESISIAEDICANKFITVSNQILAFTDIVDWDVRENNYRLVCFKLNSFEWLIDLSDAYRISKEKKYLLKGFDLIENWHKENGSIICGDKWNPYVIAERIFNWIGFCSEYSEIVNKDICTYAEWIYEQAKELKNSIEYQLGANHLLSEGKTLIAAGAFLNDTRLYHYGKKLLENEFKEQFLDDGGHYERSISYHVESLQQYFESIIIMAINKDTDYKKFIHMVSDAYNYLNGMISVSGKIPLFNDSAYDYPFYDAKDFLSTGDILYRKAPPNTSRGEYYQRWDCVKLNKGDIDWKTRVLYESSGYVHYKFKNGSNIYSFYFDVADCGPDYNLGHAHADALSVLLSSSTEEILVDSGVFTYSPGLDRNECRATKAHNTIEIDKKNSSEIWSAFRVAKRSHSKILEYSHNEHGIVIKASHDGYRNILKNSAFHTRKVAIYKADICINDYIESKGIHQAVSRFHLGSTCTVKTIDDYSCLINHNILFKCSIPITVEDCRISELFGIIKHSKCITVMLNTAEVNNITTRITIGNEEEYEK